MVALERSNPLQQSLAPYARPAPFAERAEPVIADPGRREPVSRPLVPVVEDIELQPEAAVRDPLADVPRICVSHQGADDA